MGTIADKLEFLVRVDGDYYVKDVSTGLRGGLEVRGTRVLSEAQHLDFRTADRKCQDIKKRGYPYALVTTVDGTPVTPGILRGEAPTPVDDLPHTEKDLAKVPSDEFKRRMKNDPAFVGRVHQIWKIKMES